MNDLDTDPILIEVRQAREKFLYIWPRGAECEHTAAADVFRHLERIEVIRRAEHAGQGGA